MATHPLSVVEGARSPLAASSLADADAVPSTTPPLSAGARRALLELAEARSLDVQIPGLLGIEPPRWSSPSQVRDLGVAAVEAGGQPARLWQRAEAIRWGLAVRYQRLVRALIRRAAPDDMDDLISDGLVGLVHAARGFDPSIGVAWASYAGWWARSAITRSISASREYPDGHHHIRAVARRVTQEAGLDGLAGEPLIRDLAALKINGATYSTPLIRYALSYRAPARLDEPYSADNSRRLVEAIAADVEGVDAAADDAIQRQRLSRAIALLPDRQRLIVRRRLHGWTLQEIGDELNLTRERIRQVEADAVEALRSLVLKVSISSLRSSQ